MLPIGPLIAELRMGRDLSQRQLADRLNAVTGKSLTRWDVSRWECGRRIPVVDLPALAVVLAVSQASLDEAVEEAQRVRNPSSVAANVLGTVLLSHRRLEDAVGSAVVYPAALVHLRQAESALVTASGAARDRLATVAASSAQFSGWLSSYLRKFRKADRLYDKSLRIACEAGDDDAASTALAMRGHLAWMRDDVEQMIALTRAARRLAVLPATKTIAAQQLARGHALAGEERAALGLMDEAEDLYDAHTHAPDSAYFYSGAYLTMQRGIVMFYLGRYQDAARFISVGLSALPREIQGAEWLTWYRDLLAEALKGERARR